MSLSLSRNWREYCLDDLKTWVGFCERVLLSSTALNTLCYGVEQIKTCDMISVNNKHERGW